MSADADGISFEVERVAYGDPGQLEVTGRWFGVRGRRFVRPTLTLRLRSDGSEQRALADLEHKPWAAEDGEGWMAAFPLTIELDDAEAIELHVAPDISVDLSPAQAKRGSRARVKTVAAAPDARTPQVRSETPRSRPRPASSPEVERLRERMAAAELALEREKTRRSTLEDTLESERQTARRLQAELGRVKAEGELVATVQHELETATAALERQRSEARDAARRLDLAVRELGEERRSAERLRRSLADAEAAVRRLTQAQAQPAAPVRPSRERAAGEPPPGERRSAASGRERGAAATGRERGSAPAGRERGSPPEGEERAHPDSGRSEPPPAGVPDAGRGDWAPDRHHATPRSERPLNPSLRASSWIVRGLALIVIVAVIVAIFLLIRSTVG